MARNFGYFDIAMDLTDDGIEKIDDIVKIIFQVTVQNCGKL